MLILIGSRADVFADISANLIAEFCVLATNHVITKRCREILLVGVYELFKISSRESLGMLPTILKGNSGVLFTSLHRDYVKFYKFNG